ncbi:hypothetical protein [Streptosporangium sp. NPDC023615]|uniref:hypothetical protein n=1 Tax=Streptosporangium sp. NPDC023615 TaxID=3154794 RepID=UPI003412D0C8
MFLILLGALTVVIGGMLWRPRTRLRAWGPRRRRDEDEQAPTRREVPVAAHDVRAGTGLPWPVRSYYVGVTAPGETGGDYQEWEVNWPQVSQWAAAESRKAGVGEVWVVYEDRSARANTVWTWKGGRLVGARALPWT